MNATTETFTAHLLSTDKREWSITVESIPFVLVRTVPERKSCVWPIHKLVDCVDTWTLFVVNDLGERIDVACEPGMWMSADATGKRPTVAQHTQFRLTRLMDAAQLYVEAVTRLTVMLEQLHNGDDLRKAPTKTRKLREAAAVALRFHRVLVLRNGAAFSLVAGDAVLIVAKRDKTWNELTYRIGDRAVHGGFNRYYTGVITSISPKTITIKPGHGEKSKRLTHEGFINYNDTPIEVIDKMNADWMD